jgi:hypothetical protein
MLQVGATGTEEEVIQASSWSEIESIVLPLVVANSNVQYASDHNAPICVES